MVVTYTIKVYYTRDFARTTTDIPTFVDNLIAVVNQGYINSKLPIRMALHCIEAANLRQTADGGDMLRAFHGHKGSTANLRQTADAAMLLVDDFEYCGIAWMDTFGRGSSTSVTMKRCAASGFTVAHELGHNMGALHDKVQGTNRYYPHGLGKHFLWDAERNTGRRTILAYSRGPDGKYYPRANIFSGPHTKFDWHGAQVTTGTEEEDNVRVIRENRFAFAAQGDESDTSCRAATVPPTTTTTTATTTTTTTTSTTTTPAPTTTFSTTTPLTSTGSPGCPAATTGQYLGAGDNVEGGAYLPTTGPADCATKCALHPACAAWTLSTSNNRCWLKSSIGRSGNSDGWVWGLPCHNSGSGTSFGYGSGSGFGSGSGSGSGSGNSSCVAIGSKIMLKNRLSNTKWPKARQEQVYLTASASGVSMDVYTGGEEQQWEWVDCGGGYGSLLLQSIYGRLTVKSEGKGKGKFLELGPEGTNFVYTYETKLLQESATGKAMRMWKKNARVGVVRKYNANWSYFQWEFE